MNTIDGYRTEVIDPGNAISRLAHKVCVASYNNNQAVWVVPNDRRGFRSLTGFVWRPHILRAMARADFGVDGGQNWTVKEVPQNDSAGGKPQFFTLVGTSRVMGGLGWEIIVMNADDIARWGGFPAVMVNEICFQRLTKENLGLARAIFRGYGRALKQSCLVNITGETAVMKHSITAFCDVDSDAQLIMTWGGTCIGLVEREGVINGSQIRPGLSIIGLREHGYRCNGGTFFTNLIRHHWGPEPQKILQSRNAIAFVRALTRPSISYARLITTLVGWRPNGEIGRKPLARIYGMAHITGGGVWDKFGEILPRGVGAYLENMPPPPRVLRRAQRLSQDTPYHLTDHQAYGTLHGGCGMLLVCHPDDAPAVINQAGFFGVRAGVVGRTIASRISEIVIDSRFMHRERLFHSVRPI